MDSGQLTQNNWGTITSLFGRPDMATSLKIKAFAETLYWQGPKNPAIYAKLLCWLSYRHLSGLDILVPVEKLKEEIAKHIPALQSCPRPAKQTWTQSLEMARCYLAIHDDNLSDATEFADRSIKAYDAEVNPGGIVNAMRASLLSKRPSESLHSMFKLAVRDFPTVGDPWLMDCITKSARCLEIAGWLQRYSPNALEKESEEPFHTALRKVFGLKWWAVEDVKYSALYERGYGPAQPMEIVKIANCNPSDRAIDLGCGRATLSSFFTNYTGVDVASVAIEKNRTDRPGTFVHASLDELEVLYGDQFDVAVCSDVMEHLPTEKVHDVILSISKLSSKRFLFGVCCRKAVCTGINGESLHLTVAPPAWWRDQFAKYFTVKTLKEQPTWVLFECSHL